MLTLTLHKHDPAVKGSKRPDWADKVIPGNTNRGCFTWTIRAEDIPLITDILASSNELNRALKKARLRPLIIALENTAWCHEWPDPVLIDWNWKLISGQKRLNAIAIFGARKMEELYPEGIGIRVEYGFDPKFRYLSDACETRRASDRNKFSADRTINQRINEMLLVAYKIHSRCTTSGFSDLDGNAIFDLNPEGIQWSASFRNCGIPMVDSAPVRLALAEYYQKGKEKAKRFADDLFLGYDNSKSGRLFRLWCQNNRTATDQLTYYMRAISYMEIDLYNLPQPVGQNWKKGKRWKAEPKMPDFSYVTVDLSKNEVRAQFVNLGIEYYSSVIGAVKFLSLSESVTNSQAVNQVSQNIEQWKDCIHRSKILVSALKPFSTSAIIAFFYKNPRCKSESISSTVVERLIKRGTALQDEFRSLRAYEAQTACYRILEETLK